MPPTGRQPCGYSCLGQGHGCCRKRLICLISINFLDITDSLSSQKRLGGRIRTCCGRFRRPSYQERTALQTGNSTRPSIRTSHQYLVWHRALAVSRGKLVGRPGFEPGSLCLKGRTLAHLSYRPESAVASPTRHTTYGRCHRSGQRMVGWAGIEPASLCLRGRTLTC